MVLIGIDPYPFPLFSVEGLPFSAEKPTLEPKKMVTQFQSGLPYLKKLMLEGAPHQVAKVVSISTNPQKAKTCQGIGHESRRQRWHGKNQTFNNDQWDKIDPPCPHLVVPKTFLGQKNFFEGRIPGLVLYWYMAMGQYLLIPFKMGDEHP